MHVFEGAGLVVDNVVGREASAPKSAELSEAVALQSGELIATEVERANGVVTTKPVRFERGQITAAEVEFGELFEVTESVVGYVEFAGTGEVEVFDGGDVGIDVLCGSRR